MRIDLGCGGDKHADCTGIDIRPGEHVDLVHDFEQSIPLMDNAVSFVMANRSLEYCRDLTAVMREIYRICEHKALVCVVAPYSLAAFHLANPAMRTYFNEYTPFYICSKTYRADLEATFGFAPVYMPEMPELGFRLLRMEMFYFPGSREPDCGSQGNDFGGTAHLDGVDEVMYHFVVVKQPVTNLECCVLAAGKLEEPKRITERRQRKPTAYPDARLPLEPCDNPLYIELTAPEGRNPSNSKVPESSDRSSSSAGKRKGGLRVKKGKKRSRLIRIKSVKKADLPPRLENMPVSRVLFDIRDLYIGAAWRTKREDGSEDVPV
ncbi:class I SAM-dependent methyltransferase [Paenibacillus sp. DMB20]|uniref:class I SAM-dependent methyltransferase n=1 Tax=Paenibacillus sp. DMB20 TaxID=1642570 RepID=UPI00069C2D97|nr:methyltransferase domain-containing protein [Paenibacillus sp. DMB20]